jgi:hypothetical protein
MKYNIYILSKLEYTFMQGKSIIKTDFVEGERLAKIEEGKEVIFENFEIIPNIIGNVFSGFPRYMAYKDTLKYNLVGAKEFKQVRGL